MAKERSTDKEERKREKHSKKEKRSEREGVHKSKKDRKEKKLTSAPVKDEKDVTTSKDENELTADVDMTSVLDNLENQKAQSDVKVVKAEGAPLLGALVPFANPLADEKVQKKVLKSVKKAAKNRCLKRGVKEVVKSLRKSGTAAASAGGEVPSVVVLAADISPMDVISHIPVLCEDHGVPYIFIPSRVELGAAGCTKRPTSVVMVSPAPVGKKKVGEKTEEEGDFAEVYKDLVKVVAKASREVRV